MKQTRVAIYYRVSTERQTVENQVLDLQKYCEARHWTVVETFVDDGISSTKKRTKLDDVMFLAKRRKIDVLLVWAYDRFARSTIHLINTLDDLRAEEVDFVSFQQQIDTTTPSGRLLYTITAGFAEYERSMIVERVKAGLRRVKASGKHIGRPQLPQEVKDRIRDLHAAGQSYNKIAKQISWVRASGKFGPRKEVAISKSVVGKVLKAMSTKPIPNVA